MSSVQPDLLTVEAAAQMLSIGRTTVYALMEHGELRYKRIGRARRIPRVELERFAQSDLVGGWAVQPHSQSGCLSEAPNRQGVAEAYSQRTATAESGAP